MNLFCLFVCTFVAVVVVVVYGRSGICIFYEWKETGSNRNQLLVINQLSIYECVNRFLNTFCDVKSVRCPLYLYVCVLVGVSVCVLIL